MILFLIAGLIGLYVEFSHPGLIFPGVAGGICLLIALVALHTLPVRYGAVALIVLGAALLAAEAYVTSFGALAVAGLACLVLGSLFLFDEGKSDLAVNPVLIGATSAVLAVLALAIGRLLVRIVRLPWRSMQANLVGQRAEVAAAIRPDAPGRVRLLGENWKARAERELPVGAPVVVTRVDGLVVEVEAAPPLSPTSRPA
jgi:membrane-bound serine protease (ClpP class)